MTKKQQKNGLFTLIADDGKLLQNKLNYAEFKKVADQTEEECNNWVEIDAITREIDPSYVSDADAMAEINTLLQ